MVNCQIANNQLNSGTAVDLGAVSWSVAMKRLSEIKPIRGQNVTSSYSIADGDNLGIENPVITIAGTIDLEDFANVTALHATSSITEVTLGYLKALWRIRGDSTTTLNLYAGLSEFSYKNFDGSSDDLTVIIDTIDIVPDVNSDKLHFFRFTIKCREITT